MGFYFRKSKSFGPFRVNLSKSGVGVSTGVKGARVSFGPRGTYVNLGRNGIYYRKKVGGGLSKKTNNTNIPENSGNSASPTYSQLGFDPTDSIRVFDNPNSESEIGKDIVKRIKRVKITKFSVIYFSLLLIVVFKEIGLAAACIISLFVLIFYSAKVTFDLDPEAESEWNQFGNSLISQFRSCNRIWLKENEQINPKGVKYGAGFIVARSTAVCCMKNPKSKNTFGFKANVVTYEVTSKKCNILFLPSGIMVKKGSRIYSYSYSQISMSPSSVRFVESDPVPYGAEVVGQRWKYANLDGSPDRRFNGNYQLPICKYGVITIDGAYVGIELQTSNNTVPSAVSDAFKLYKEYYHRISQADNSQSDTLNDNNPKALSEAQNNNVNYGAMTVTEKMRLQRNTAKTHSQGSLSPEQRKILEDMKKSVCDLGKAGYIDLLTKEFGCGISFVDGQTYMGHAILLYRADANVVESVKRIENNINANNEYRHRFDVVSENEFLIHLYMPAFKEFDKDLPLSPELSRAIISAYDWNRPNKNHSTSNDKSNEIPPTLERISVSKDHKIIIPEDNPNKEIPQIDIQHEKTPSIEKSNETKEKDAHDSAYDDLFDITDDSDKDTNDNTVDDLMSFFDEE